LGRKLRRGKDGAIRKHPCRYAALAVIDAADVGRGLGRDLAQQLAEQAELLQSAEQDLGVLEIGTGEEGDVDDALEIERDAPEPLEGAAAAAAAAAEAEAAGELFLLANTITLVVVLISKPLGGWLSDKVGRRRLMMALTVAVMALIYPALQMMLYGAPGAFIVGQILVAVPIGMALGLQGAMVVEIFPLRSRVTSMSLAYSVTLALAGGTAPLVSAWLIETLGHPLAPAYYIMLYGAIGLSIMWPMAETNTRALDE
jgi:hypothetical protein